MSLPPEIITVKRKRRAEGDNEPVNFLRVEETNLKRQASGTWLYRRKQPEIPSIEQSPSPNKAPDGRPSIQTSRPGDEKRLLRNQANALSASQLNHNVIAPAVPQPGDAALPSNSNAGPRRFHMTMPTEAPARGKRARYASAVFVERSVKRKKTLPVASEEDAKQPAKQDDTVMEGVGARLKRPGVKVRTRAAQQPASLAPEVKKPELPPSLRNRTQGDMDEITREMDNFILQQINHDWAKLEAEPKPKTTPIKYRPKATQRYTQRHPEVACKGEEDVDMDQSETEDEDYVLETYVRVPAHTLTAPVPAEQVGLLVFDKETDIEYFCGAGDDSSDEYDEDDEDSNAEDYYAADYPEDEVASDDEFGRDDYHYRNGNASDMEEFDGVGEDEDDMANSDDEQQDQQASSSHARRTGGAADLWRLEKTMRAALGLPKATSQGSSMAMDD